MRVHTKVLALLSMQGSRDYQRAKEHGALVQVLRQCWPGTTTHNKLVDATCVS